MKGSRGANQRLLLWMCNSIFLSVSVNAPRTFPLSRVRISQHLLDTPAQTFPLCERISASGRETGWVSASPLDLFLFHRDNPQHTSPDLPGCFKFVLLHRRGLRYTESGQPHQAHHHHLSGRRHGDAEDPEYHEKHRAQLQVGRGVRRDNRRRQEGQGERSKVQFEQCKTLHLGFYERGFNQALYEVSSSLLEPPCTLKK